jgi:hypothetical protein
MLGGMRRPDQAKCSHAETAAVRSTGIERIVCEACGHVSFSFQTESDAEIEREMFARPIDFSQEPATAGTF